MITVFNKTKPFFKYLLYVFITWWAIYTIKNQLYIKQAGWNFTPGSISSSIAVLGFWIKSTLEVFSSLSVKTRIFCSRFIHSGIEMDLKYTTYQTHYKMDNLLYEQLRKAVKDSGGKKIECLKNTVSLAKLSANINGNTHIFVYQISEKASNKFQIHLEINAIKSNYVTVEKHLKLFDTIKKKLVTSTGGIQTGPTGEEEELYKANLKFASATPFYRYTVKDLQKKKEQIQYTMKIPDSQGTITIHRNSQEENIMDIASSNESFLVESLKKYFLELPDA